MKDGFNNIMNNPEYELLSRTFPGSTVPDSLPPEALFILNLGPYLTDESQTFQGNNERHRSLQLYALAEKLEEIAEILEEIRDEQNVGTDPGPEDVELMDEEWGYLNGVLAKLFAKISGQVENLEKYVNEAK